MLAVRPLPVLDKDLRPVLKQKLMDRWQISWSATDSNKLRSIKTTVSEWHTSSRSARREEVVLTRLRIGHTLFTHSFLMRGHACPVCNKCGVPVTVRHILTECRGYRFERRICDLPVDLAQQLGDSPVQLRKVFRFLKIIKLYKAV